jgi:tetratricopeptide (TPR) repeat protein
MLAASTAPNLTLQSLTLHLHCMLYHALQACQAALAIAPDYYEATKELIRALLAAERFEEAVNLARNALQQHQQDGELHQVGGRQRACFERCSKQNGSSCSCLMCQQQRLQ